MVGCVIKLAHLNKFLTAWRGKLFPVDLSTNHRSPSARSNAAEC